MGWNRDVEIGLEWYLFSSSFNSPIGIDNFSCFIIGCSSLLMEYWPAFEGRYCHFFKLISSSSWLQWKGSWIYQQLHWFRHQIDIPEVLHDIIDIIPRSTEYIRFYLLPSIQKVDIQLYGIDAGASFLSFLLADPPFHLFL
jgi:hypothetical protein